MSIHLSKIALGGIVVAALCLMGCGGQSMIENNWGRSYESARYNQILNPDAGKNLDPVVGMSGEMADRAMKNYIHGKKADERPKMEITVSGKK